MSAHADHDAALRRVLYQVFAAAATEVACTREQETVHPVLGVLRPGTQFLVIDTPEKPLALRACMDAGDLHVIHGPNTFVRGVSHE